jgi:mRNA-degrading endonuclease toxin of MazEF toxin-antitoxin module
MTAHRGAVYRREIPRDRYFVVVATDELTSRGTTVTAEIGDIDPDSTRNLVAVVLQAADPVPGVGSVLCWRLSWVATERLGDYVGDLSPSTLAAVDRTLHVVLAL